MFRDRDLEKLKSELVLMKSHADEAAENLIKDVTKIAAEDMHSRVDRIDTERMKGSVSYITEGKRGKFGWYIGDSIDKDQRVIERPNRAYNGYFVFQEHGFRNAKTGQVVPPMHALMHSFIDARELLRDELVRLAKH